MLDILGKRTSTGHAESLPIGRSTMNLLNASPQITMANKKALVTTRALVLLSETLARLSHLISGGSSFEFA